MAEVDKKKFFEWYTLLFKIPNYIFDFEHNCSSTVQRSLESFVTACLKIKEGFITGNNVDPFTQVVTIKGACMATYHTNHLLHDIISVIPARGYRLS